MTTTTTTITEASHAAPAKGGRMLIQLITPGTGSSGVYAPEVLEAAARARVFPAGTLMHIDHATEREQRERPEGSLTTLAGTLTEDAYWDGRALVAEAKTYQPWSSVLADMGDAIGVSIRAAARVDESDDQGRPVIAELVEGISVDFVTRAGRGGQILEVLESARRVQETLPGGLTAGDLERRLDELLGPDAWVEDLTDEWIVYRRYEDGQGHLVQQGYTSDPDGRVALTGTPTRVSRRVTYDAASQDPPSVSAGVAMESHERKEPVVAQIQIDEAEHKRLTEAADKVAKADAEIAEAVKHAEEAEAALKAAEKAADLAEAERVIAAAGVQFTALESKGLHASLPLLESGRLDVPTFERAVKEAAAEKAEQAGAGRPSGFGVSESNTQFTEDDLDKVLGIQKGDR